MTEDTFCSYCFLFRSIRFFLVCTCTIFLCYVLMDINFTEKISRGMLSKMQHSTFTGHSGKNHNVSIPLYKNGINLDYNMSAYPHDTDFKALVKNIKMGLNVTYPVINPHNFNYMHEVPSCRENLTVLILVTSASQYLFRRKAIRETWGRVLPTSIQVVFLLGKPSSSSLQISILKEHKKYRDIIQEDFQDKYKNLIIKKTMGFYWAIRSCSSVQYLLFVDDDTYVFPYSLHNYVQRIQQHKNSNIYRGYMYQKEYPYRLKESKYYVSFKEYPYNTYPPYIRGGAYFVSYDVAKEFATAFPYIQPFPMEDVWMGIVARKLRIPMENDSAFNCKLDFCRQRLSSGNCIVYVGVYSKEHFKLIETKIRSPSRFQIWKCHILNR